MSSGRYDSAGGAGRDEEEDEDEKPNAADIDDAIAVKAAADDEESEDIPGVRSEDDEEAKAAEAEDEEELTGSAGESLSSFGRMSTMMKPMMNAPMMNAQTNAMGIFQRRNAARRGEVEVVESDERGDGRRSSLTPNDE